MQKTVIILLVTVAMAAFITTVDCWCGRLPADDGCTPGEVETKDNCVTCTCLEDGQYQQCCGKGTAKASPGCKATLNTDTCEYELARVGVCAQECRIVGMTG
ncbi:uncharacterized protein LOC144433571 [Glandiceps talaboti]